MKMKNTPRTEAHTITAINHGAISVDNAAGVPVITKDVGNGVVIASTTVRNGTYLDKVNGHM